MFPIAIIAFVGVGIKYITQVFTPTTRWFFLALLALSLIRSGRILSGFYTQFAPFILLYCGWILLTCTWSTVPELSILKAIATICMIFLFTAAGRYWVSGWTTSRPLFYLTPIVAAALPSAFWGANSTPSAGVDMQLYQGLTGNPNQLGIVVAASFPLIIFLLCQVFTRGTLLQRATTVIAALILVTLLLQSGSRASIIVALSVSAFAILALRFSKIITVTILIGSAIGIAVAIVPEIQDQTYTRFVVKYSPDGNLFYSRQEPWQESVKGARQGGWFGLGYGAAYGYKSFSGGLTSVGYGRETGNSQLAIIEEIGIVGLGFYALLLFSIIGQLIGGLRRTHDQERRLEIALVTGLVIGIVLQSGFEGWWTSPGSAESAIFWATVGVGSGLVRRRTRVRFEHRPSPLGLRTVRRPLPAGPHAGARNSATRAIEG